MKKWLIGLPLIIVIIVAATYIAIPSDLIISRLSSVKSSSSEVSRILTNEAKWTNWWPLGSNKKEPLYFNYNDLTYHLAHKYYNSIELDISDKKEFLSRSRINVIKITIDSTIIQWESRISTSINPFKRISQYRKAVHIKDNMGDILNRLASYLENNANVYGVKIEQIISKDSTLVSTNKIFDSYPTTSQIYELIDHLKNHIAKERGRENNFPMLSVKKLPGEKFEIIVAIAVNGKLNETSTIVNKRFVPWKTLTGDVHGGIHSVENALLQMQIYIDDHQRNAMGIPFQSLITDRRTEPDTSKWITKICQAVS